VDDYLAAGSAMQRLWLCATAEGLFIQPEMTPLIFSRYVREGRAFSASPGAGEFAASLMRRLERLLGAEAADRAVFVGRIGAGARPTARSLRLPLDQLIVSGPQPA
jgi:hypothetical protein